MGSGIVPPRPPPETLRPPDLVVYRQLVLYRNSDELCKICRQARQGRVWDLMERMKNCKAHVPAEAAARESVSWQSFGSGAAR